MNGERTQRGKKRIVCTPEWIDRVGNLAYLERRRQRAGTPPPKGP